MLIILLCHEETLLFIELTISTSTCHHISPLSCAVSNSICQTHSPHRISKTCVEEVYDNLKRSLESAFEKYTCSLEFGLGNGKNYHADTDFEVMVQGL